MQKTEELLNFLYNSTDAFHATNNVSEILKENDYKEIFEYENWNLENGGKYFVKKNNSAIIAFEIGTGKIGNDGFKIIGAHTDSPTFKIKPYHEMKVENTYVKLNTESYGGGILSTWFDRPLSISGRVVVKGENVTKPVEKLLKIDRPIMVIPNLAIHMNRNINDGYTFNKQVDMLPLLALVNGELEKESYLLNLISNELNIKKEDIIDFELFLYDTEKGMTLGINNEFFLSSRLDDLWMVYSGLQALINSKPNKSTKVLLCLDNEEVGSRTQQGADSAFVKNVLERICLVLGESKEEFYKAINNSFMISSDLAHGVHPNYTDKHDPTNRPVLGKGPVIKYSSNQKYSTNSVIASVIYGIAEKNNIPYQKFVNRSDLAGGSTIGPIMSSILSIPTVDIGTAILSMHSIKELGAVSDIQHVENLFTAFYEA